MKNYLILIIMLIGALNLQAQIGYQISLLNTATGEPRANETVNVTVTLTNSEGGIIYTGNQSATTNDFGVLSLTIGDADTFKEVDVTKMPFYVEVSANGVSIGKSQVLSVPVAEYAKRTGTLTKELLVGTWVSEVSYSGEVNSSYPIYDKYGVTQRIPFTYTDFGEIKYSYTFNSDGTAIFTSIVKYWTMGYKGDNGVPDDYIDDRSQDPIKYEYVIDGNNVLLFKDATPKDASRYNNWTYTYLSSPFANKRLVESMFYIDSIGMLGDGFTKLK